MKPSELAQVGTFDLLQALILANNTEAEEWRASAEYLISSRETINDQIIMIKEQADEILLQKDLVEKHEKTIKHYEFLLLEAEKVAQKNVAINRELGISKAKVTELQKEITGMGNAKKNAALVKTQKAKAVERNKRIERLEREAKEHTKELKEEKLKVAIAVDKVREMQRQLDHNTGAGLYHNGEHHLIIWPEKTKMQRPDGTIFEGRSLLYLHQAKKSENLPKIGYLLLTPCKKGLCAIPT